MRMRSAKTFAELYCEQHDLAREDFDKVVLHDSLYPTARLLQPFLTLLRPSFFSADLDLVRGTALLRRSRDFSAEIADFFYHPENRSVLRRVFKLRVSVSRLRRILYSTLEHPVARGKSPPPPQMVSKE